MDAAINNALEIIKHMSAKKEEEDGKMTMNVNVNDEVQKGENDMTGEESKEQEKGVAGAKKAEGKEVKDKEEGKEAEESVSAEEGKEAEESVSAEEDKEAEENGSLEENSKAESGIDDESVPKMEDAEIEHDCDCEGITAYGRFESLLLNHTSLVYCCMDELVDVKRQLDAEKMKSRSRKKMLECLEKRNQQLEDDVKNLQIKLKASDVKLAYFKKGADL